MKIVNKLTWRLRGDNYHFWIIKYVFDDDNKFIEGLVSKPINFEFTRLSDGALLPDASFIVYKENFESEVQLNPVGGIVCKN